MSIWPRYDAEASPERGYYYYPSRHFARQPIVAGWVYYLTALLASSATGGGPAVVVCAHPAHNANEGAVEQRRGCSAACPSGAVARLCSSSTPATTP